MEDNGVPSRKGSTRRSFLSASAVGAVAAPIVVRSGPAKAARPHKLIESREPDHGLRDLIRRIDPDRIRNTITTLTQFGTRHTASSQTDPARGIGAATAW